ncbi:MAG: phosphate ABC transporter substrate-binding protein PstS [Planctomycetota bacterium]
MKLAQVGALIVAGMCLVAGCGRPAASADPTTAIEGAGSTFAAPLIDTWGKEYHKRNPQVAIAYEGVGSGEGEKRFLEGVVDFGATDAGLPSDALNAVSGGAIQVPITAGIVVLAYNPRGLPANLRLPRAVYADVFLGKTVRWNDERIQKANPGKSLPNEEIALVVRLDDSGTTYAMTNHLAAISPQWRETFGNKDPRGESDLGVQNLDWPGRTMRVAGNSGVAGRIKQTPYSLGYVQYGAAREVDLGMAALENKAGNYVEPSGTSGLETLLNALMPPDLLAYFPDPDGEYSYPIVTFTWTLLRKQYSDTSRTETIKGFVHWCLTRGQDFSEAAGNVRLAPHVVRAAEKALDTMGTP